VSRFLRLLLMAAVFIVFAGALFAFVMAMHSDAHGVGLSYLAPGRVDVWLDPETGCEYLLHEGRFRRRMKPDGTQLCDGGR
jgi:hypothetical protein